MSAGISRFLFGETRLLIRAPAEEAADFLLQRGFPAYDLQKSSSGLEATVESKDRRALTVLCRKGGYETEILEEKGLPALFRFLLLRPGLALGALTALLILFLNADYVWRIEVFGNERYTGQEVVAMLKEHGFYIGCRHKSLDLHALCNEIPMTEKGVGWISINMMGSVAEVRLAEYRPAPGETPQDPPKEARGPVNLVADRPGEIVRFELSCGRAAASVGQTVKKGQLLAAGFSEKDDLLHARVSAGKVYAKTVLYKEVFIPCEYTEKTGEKNVLLTKSLKFSGKELFFYKKGRLLGEKYDIVIDEYRPTVFKIALPVTVCRQYAVFPLEERLTRSKEEAAALAEKELLALLRAEGALIVQKEFFYTERPDGIHAVCQALCIMNIARASAEDPPSAPEPL